MNIIPGIVNRKIISGHNVATRQKIRTFLKYLFKRPVEYPFHITRPEKCEFDLIVKEMYRSFYPDEPVSFSLKFRCDPKLDELVYEALSENISVVAKCRYSGELLAASINRTTNPWDSNLLDRIACTLCTKGKNILHLRAHLMRAHDLWKYYGVQKIFDVQYMFVKKEERKQGIPWQLITASRNISADCGYPIFRIISTNEYLHKVCEKYRMHRIYELPFCTYIGADWKPVCEPPPPHFSARVYIDNTPHLTFNELKAAH
ncbi:hypothetical protein WA026_005453 [Henosepilachna vigintioctopunctata]|uniref:Uncharacterized protein n=1 Tax=Henosepilachna vigintioctopunctata TaxID=420089 RepID=A0AAW1TV07_9CUCU